MWCCLEVSSTSFAKSQRSGSTRGCVSEGSVGVTLTQLHRWWSIASGSDVIIIMAGDAGLRIISSLWASTRMCSMCCSMWLMECSKNLHRFLFSRVGDGSEPARPQFGHVAVCGGKLARAQLKPWCSSHGYTSCVLGPFLSMQEKIAEWAFLRLWC
jgi:hypothetical protein